MNSMLIKRFYDTLDYYNPNEQIYPRFKGYYDFLILQKYLNSKNKNFKIGIDNKIYIYNLNLHSEKIELSEFLNIYEKEFYVDYENILRTLKYPLLKRMIMIYMYRCSFCENKEQETTFIIENIYTRQGYQYCKFCERFAKYSFIKFKIKKLFLKLKLYFKAVGKLIVLYKTLKSN